MSISKPAKTSRKPARASATAALPAALIPAKPAPVAVLPAESDAAGRAKMAKGDAKPETHVDQALVDAFLNAESGVREAAVNLFYACTVASVAPAQFGARSDAKVRASEFNRAWIARGYFGADAVRKMIAAAAANVGDKRANVLAALRKACELGASVKAAKLKGAALSKALSKASSEAQSAATAAGAAGESTKAGRAPHHNAPQPRSLESFATLALATLATMLDNLAKVDVPPRKLGKVKELASTLDEAADMLKGLAPKAE